MTEYRFAARSTSRLPKIGFIACLVLGIATVVALEPGVQRPGVIKPSIIVLSALLGYLTLRWLSRLQVSATVDDVGVGIRTVDAPFLVAFDRQIRWQDMIRFKNEGEVFESGYETLVIRDGLGKFRLRHPVASGDDYHDFVAELERRVSEENTGRGLGLQIDRAPTMYESVFGRVLAVVLAVAIVAIPIALALWGLPRRPDGTVRWGSMLHLLWLYAIGGPFVYRVVTAWRDRDSVNREPA